MSLKNSSFRFTMATMTLNSIDALSVNRVQIDTRPTQAAYNNKPDNWRERNRIGLTNLKKHLRTCIDSANHGERFKLNLAHNSSWDQIRDDEEPIVWHDSSLDEYWDQLDVNFYRRKQLGIVSTYIRSIYIENVEIKKGTPFAALVANVSETEKPLIQVRLSISLTPIFVTRALYGCQSWWMLVPSYRIYTLVTIGLITWIRLVAFPGR